MPRVCFSITINPEIIGLSRTWSTRRSRKHRMCFRDHLVDHVRGDHKCLLESAHRHVCCLLTYFAYKMCNICWHFMGILKANENKMVSFSLTVNSFHFANSLLHHHDHVNVKQFDSHIINDPMDRVTLFNTRYYRSNLPIAGFHVWGLVGIPALGNKPRHDSAERQSHGNCIGNGAVWMNIKSCRPGR